MTSIVREMLIGVASLEFVIKDGRYTPRDLAREFDLISVEAATHERIDQILRMTLTAEECDRLIDTAYKSLNL